MLKVGLKFTIVAALLFWLFSSQEMDVAHFFGQELFLTLFTMNNHLIWSWLGIFIVVSSPFLTNLRWTLLITGTSGLSPNKKQHPYGKLLQLTWVGLFFNGVLPGSVTGDFIKAEMTHRFLNKQRSYIYTSVLIDRIWGLLGLVFWFAVASLCLGHLGLGILTSLGLTCCIFIMCYPGAKIRLLVQNIPMAGAFIADILAHTHTMGQKSVVLLILSIINQAALLLAMYLLIIDPQLQQAIADLGILHFLAVAPLGLIFVAIPISPGGLGVGHGAFAVLLSAQGISQGAKIYHNYFLAIMLLSAIGGVVYLLSGINIKRKNDHE